MSLQGSVIGDVFYEEEEVVEEERHKQLTAEAHAPGEHENFLLRLERMLKGGK